jgi:glycosyltransferase involved in cell wall biosynthesis
MYKLTIYIPTFNREKYLKECLNSVLSQVKGYSNQVEVIVSDNASTDGTQNLVNEFILEYPFLKYYRNPNNLGYSGNQAKCFELSQGKYIAFLGDDDIYTYETIKELLNIITKRDYAFIAMNYFSFTNNINKPYKVNLVENKDVLFERAYDIMNYPTVGHWSGFVFNRELSITALKTILHNHPLEYYEKYRGLITEVAIRSALSSKLPSLFIGKMLLAARLRKEFDYNMLDHICIDYYEYNYRLYKDGLITEKDLEHRADEVLRNLPRAIVNSIGRKTKNEVDSIINKLKDFFKNYYSFWLFDYPLLLLAKIHLARFIFEIVHKFLRRIKYLAWSFKAGA